MNSPLPDTQVSSPFLSSSEDDTPPSAWAALKIVGRSFRQEHSAFLLTCVYFIFEYNKLQLVYPVIDVIPWAKALFLLTTVVALSDKASRRPPAAAVYPLVLFSLSILVSSSFAFSRSVAVEGWTVFGGWIFIVALLTCVVTTRQRLFLFLVVYFLSNAKMAQHGFRTWVMRGFGYSDWGATGSPGWFQNSGEFGMEMAVFLPLALAYLSVFRREWSRQVRVLFYLLVVTVVCSVIASSSRGAILGLVAVGLSSLAYSRKRIKGFIILCIISAVVYAVMPDEFKDRFSTAGEDKTSTLRLTYWRHALEAFGTNSITGIGYCNWRLWVESKHPETAVIIGGRVHVEVLHNTYLEVLSEQGVLGAVVYCLLLLQVFLTNHRSLRTAKHNNDRFLQGTAMGLNGGLMAFLVASFFMSVFNYPFIWMLLALTICVSHAGNCEIKEELGQGSSVA